MIIRLTLRQSLLLTVGLISIVILCMCFINYRALKGEKENIIEFGRWSKIDMMMNEDVLANFEALKTAFLYWQNNPSQKSWVQVEETLKNTEKGLSTWSKIVSNEPELSRAVLKWEGLLDELKTTILSCKEFQDQRGRYVQAIEKNYQKLRALLESTMENTIHSARERAVISGDIKAFAYWTDIDMKMNEEVIQPFLNFQKALEAYLIGQEDAKAVKRELTSLEKGLREWLSLVKSEPLLKKAGADISELVGEAANGWPKIRENTEKLRESSLLITNKVFSLKQEADTVMERLINPVKAKILSESIETADKNILFSLIEFGIAFLLIGVIAFGARRASRPLMALIDRLKDLAVGETDLTKQLEVKGINCSQIMECNNHDCPVYGKEAHCWYEAGSYAPEIRCPRIREGVYSSCEECKVYKQAIKTEIEEISTFVNAFIRRVWSLVGKVKKQTEEVVAEARRLSAISEQLASGAEETQAHAEDVNRVAETTSKSLSSVAAAMEEMIATVNEIAKHTTRASQIAQDAKEEAAKAQGVIRNLAQASKRISEVSKLIGSIADQTKLLALNANIEAAHAGEAGKGFAVVANEVKELAQQTGNSVIDIDTMVKDLQQGVSQALEAMDRISEVIQQVAEFSSNIASAIEEQTTATNEVNANTQRVSEEVKDMARMSEAIATAGNQTAQGAEDIRTTARKLRSLSDELQEMLDEFKT